MLREKGIIKNNRKGKTIDLLAWPSSHRLSKSGWLLGWRTTAQTPSNNNNNTSYCGLDAMIVAGVLESPRNHQENIPLAREYEYEYEYDAIDSLLKKTSKACCFCCACCGDDDESSNGDENKLLLQLQLQLLSNCCSGCTRRICFETLGIIAFASEKEKTVSATIHAKNIPVPLVRIDKTGRPLSPPQQEDMKWRQLLVYDDHRQGNTVSNQEDTLSFCLFRSNVSHPKSYFSRELLTRLTHASVVLEVIQKAERDEEPRPDDDDVAVSPQNQISLDPDTSGAADAVCNNNNKEDGFLFHPGSSLFVRQLQCSSCSPLWTFARSFSKLQNRQATRKPKTCKKCGKLQMIDDSNYKKAHDFIVMLNAMVVSIVDVAIGILLGLLLVIYILGSDVSLSYRAGFWIKSHYDLLLRALDWLERFPIGFKLNVRLTQSMGKGIRSLISLHEWMLYGLGSFVSKLIQKNAGFAIFGLGVVFGASGLIALLSDVIKLTFAHIFVLDFCFRQLYSNELYLLRALWRLFRGKKRNILRQRTDTMEYDSTQLLLGTILFTVALFMLTTVVVYHSFFAVLDLLVLSLTALLTSIYVILRRFPCGNLWLRMKRPQWFIEDIYLEDISLFSEGSDWTHLRAVASSPSAIIGNELMHSMKDLASWIGRFLVNSFTGQGR